MHLPAKGLIAQGELRIPWGEGPPGNDGVLNQTNRKVLVGSSEECVNQSQELEGTNSLHTYTHTHTWDTHTPELSRHSYIFMYTLSHRHMVIYAHTNIPQGPEWTYTQSVLNLAPSWGLSGSKQSPCYPSSLPLILSFLPLSSLPQPICEHMTEPPDCSQTFNLVCGTDGVTYNSECHLCLARM